MDDSSSAWLHELEIMDDTVGIYWEDNLSTVDRYYPSFKTSTGDLACKQPSINVNPSPPHHPQNLLVSHVPSISNRFTISFGNIPEIEKPVNDDMFYGGVVINKPPKDETLGNDLVTMYHSKVSNVPVRNSLQAQDHVLAERRRREKLTQRFIALSALLPNLKKLDKASVLEDATKYIKQLQNRVKELEQDHMNSSTTTSTKRKSLSSVWDDADDIVNHRSVAVSVKKRSRICSGDYGEDSPNSSSSDENISPGKAMIGAANTTTSPPHNLSPEIQVQVLESSVLVRIFCEDREPNLLVKALTEINNLGLTIISSNAMPFSSTALLITIVAQMEDEFFIKTTDIIKSLQKELF